MIAWRLATALWSAGLAAALAVYPWREHGLWLVLAAYAVAVLWRPRLWLALLLALLPVLDLAPLTGWFFLEELDLLLLVAAACGYLRMAALAPAPASLPKPYQLALIAMSLLCLAATARVVLPWQGSDINSFNNYLSPMNALRVGKPWLGLLILLPLLRRTLASRDDLKRYLLPGVLAGLLLVCCAAIAERIIFPGLTNFSADYRISAPFSAMHTGGAALDSYLALSVPLLALAYQGCAPRWRWLLTGLLAMALYTCLATFSRGLYAGMALAAVILAAGTCQPPPRRTRRDQLDAPGDPHPGGGGIGHVGADHAHAGPSRRLPPLALPPRPTFLPRLAPLLLGLAALAALYLAFRLAGYRVLAAALAPMLAACWRAGARACTWAAALLCGAIVIPVASSEYAGVRMGSSWSDLQARLRHWQAVLELTDQPWLGMGMGRFPALYYWHNPAHEQPAAYQYLDIGGNRQLALLGADYRSGYGEVLRMLQRADVQPYASYLLSLDVRSEGPPAFLRPGLCERQLLYPVNCQRLPTVALAPAPGWRHIALPVATGPLTRHAPVWLELAAEGQRARVMIDNVSLYDLRQGRELLRNGGFSALQDHWFFSSDHHHLPWHIKNLPLNVYFETGVAGLLALLVLLLAATATLLLRRQAAWLACLAAFLAVGMFDSLIDVPRITLLFLLLLTASQLRPCISREVIPGSSRRGKKKG